MNVTTTETAMLILADLSGIQDYLFEVRDTGGKQARSLRFRSLYIQLIAEAIGVRLLRAATLNKDRLIFCAAGKIAIDGADIDAEQRKSLDREIREIGRWLRDKTHARLRLSVAIYEQPDVTMRERFDAAGRVLQRSRLRGWSGLVVSESGWRSSELLAASPPNTDEEAERDAELGRQVVQGGSTFLVMEQAGNGGVDVAGLSARFVSRQPTDGGALHVRDMAGVMRHVPTTEKNGEKEAVGFVELAKRSRGAAMLGVLKADADSLGAAITQCLTGARDLQPLQKLSGRLEDFFASDLDQQMRNDARWSKQLYTVFSGGDDLLLVGPWDIVLDFAGHLQQQFTQRFKDDQLTISAGVAIIKPKFPIRLAAQQADDLLDEAKSGTKDQCAALGGLWKWSDHERIIDAGKQLADWVDAGVIERGWLHTILELALLRRGEIPDAPQHEQVMATARLAYHVARNWPKLDARNNDPIRQEKLHQARVWINDVLESFDDAPDQAIGRVRFLPFIVRYIMLATRSTSDKE